MKYLLTAVLFVSALVPSHAFAAGDDGAKKATWSCAPLGETKPEVLRLVQWGDQSYVEVFDEEILARYSMNGLEKRWDWGKFVVLLGPDGTAEYSDNKNGMLMIRERYSCKKK